ncbi:hypothetical protein FRC07_003604 [Ceratobasidium sp. 392]|nr:hypothetical protein FRC07_003604 [Ceratobasidium sp. 392]
MFSSYLVDGPIVRAIRESDPEELNESIEDAIINIILDQMQAKGRGSYQEKLIWGAMDKNSSQECWIYSMRAFVQDMLAKAVAANIVSLRADIQLQDQLTQMEEPSLPRTITVFEYQRHIRSHVEAYADRVDKYHLETPEIVIQDVEEAISGIWDLMLARRQELMS